MLLFVECPSARAQGAGLDRFPLSALVVFALEPARFAQDRGLDQVCHGAVSLGRAGGQESCPDLPGVFDGEVRANDAGYFLLMCRYPRP